MRKAILCLIVLLSVGLLTAVSLATHYRALCRDALRTGAPTEASPPQRFTDAPGKSDPVGPGPAAKPLAAEEAVAMPDPVVPLKNRIRELETQLAERDTRLAALLKASAEGSPARGPERRDRFPAPDALRTNDPALYAEMDRRRQEAQKSMQNALARQADFVLKKDTSNLSDEAKEQHEELVRLLDETWKITQQMQATATREERRELMRTMGENLRALDPLLVSERNREFYSLGLSVGYSPDEATQFASYLNDVINLTSTRTLFPGFRGSFSRGSGSGSGGTGTGGAGTATR
jgi:hypothetical protein